MTSHATFEGLGKSTCALIRLSRSEYMGGLPMVSLGSGVLGFGRFPRFRCRYRLAGAGIERSVGDQWIGCAADATLSAAPRGNSVRCAEIHRLWVLTLLGPVTRIPGSYVCGGVLKRPTRADCKSAGLCLRRFESFPLHQSLGIGGRRGGGTTGLANGTRNFSGGCSSMVELQPSKLAVVGSTHTARSIKEGDVPGN